MRMRQVRPGTAAIALLGLIGVLLDLDAMAQHATTEEVDAAVKFYNAVKADRDKRQAYCDVREGIKMMTSDPKKFAEAQRKVAAATKKLGPDFSKAQTLSTRLDVASEQTKRYISARQALDKTCP